MEQQQLWAEGRTTPGPNVTVNRPLGDIVTHEDGVVHKSRHQGVDPNGNPCSLAIDFGIFVGGKYMMDASYYKPFQAIAHQNSLISGWDFTTMFPGTNPDPPHFELNQKLTPLDWSYLKPYPTSDSTAV
jgi:hypothetical protein